MEMKACLYCKHHESKLGEFVNGKHEMKHKCHAGNDEAMHKWWIDNGEKNRKVDHIDELPCFEQHEISKCLDRMNELADKMIANTSK